MEGPQPHRSESQSSPPAASHQVADDDIALPPAVESAAAGASDDQSGRPTDQPQRKRGGTLVTLGLVIAAALAVAGSWYFGSSSAEVNHPNWPHVIAATEAADAGEGSLVRVDEEGSEQVTSEILVSADDLDTETTEAVRQSIQQNDPQAVVAQIQAAQQLPDANVEPEIAPVTPGSELHQDIEQGRVKFYQMQLFDCCDEDGDVVEVVVNGQSFMTVPIFHEGATVSIPLQPGANSVAIRGVEDGGGGITVSFQTQEGHYFSRRLRVGQTHEVGVIVQ